MIKLNSDNGYQQCAISVMDNISDPDISFDKNGICNYYYEYLNAEQTYVKKGNAGKMALNQIISNTDYSGSNPNMNVKLLADFSVPFAVNLSNPTP